MSSSQQACNSSHYRRSGSPEAWPGLRRSAAAAVEAEQKLQTPHGNKLVDLMLAESEREAAKAACTKTLELSDRNACDVELLCVGCARCRRTGCCSSACTCLAAARWLLRGYAEGSPTCPVCDGRCAHTRQGLLAS